MDARIARDLASAARETADARMRASQVVAYEVAMLRGAVYDAMAVLCEVNAILQEAKVAYVKGMFSKR